MLSLAVLVGATLALFGPIIGAVVYSHRADRRRKARYREEYEIMWALEERCAPEEVAQIIADYERRYKRRLVIVSAGTPTSGAIIRCEQR